MKGSNQRDGSHNVKSTKTNLQRTAQNMETANELIAKTGDRDTREALEKDNANRARAMEDMQIQVKADAKHHKP